MMSLLAAGGAIAASELAMQGEPAFALVRPPGHHATVDDCWGFCWLNNMAIAIERLRRMGRIEKALLEGGYNPKILGPSIRALLEGLEGLC